MNDESEETEAPKKKRKKAKSPTARTLDQCRKRGWEAQVVERRIPKSFVTVDLFNCIDIIAITPQGIVGIQATSDNGGNHAARVHKVMAEPRAKKWVEAGARLEVWSWRKHGRFWAARVEDLTTELRQIDPADVREAA